MEDNVSKESKNDYNSILQSIRHKPIIVKNIFSFLKNEPKNFLNLIEKDKILKDSINSIFSNMKKKHKGFFR